jgi:hypothetical protein
MKFAAPEPIINCREGQERRKPSHATAPIQTSAFAIQRARLKAKRSASTATDDHAAKAVRACRRRARQRRKNANADERQRVAANPAYEITGNGFGVPVVVLEITGQRRQ